VVIIERKERGVLRENKIQAIEYEILAARLTTDGYPMLTPTRMVHGDGVAYIEALVTRALRCHIGGVDAYECRGAKVTHTVIQQLRRRCRCVFAEPVDDAGGIQLEQHV